MTRDEILNHVLNRSEESYSPEGIFNYSLPGSGLEYSPAAIERVTPAQAEWYRGKSPAGGFLPLLFKAPEAPAEEMDEEQVREMQRIQAQQPIQIEQQIQLQQPVQQAQLARQAQLAQQAQLAEQAQQAQRANVMAQEQIQRNVSASSLDAQLRQPIQAERNLSYQQLEAQIPVNAQANSINWIDVSKSYPQANMMESIPVRNYPEALPGREMISINQNYPQAKTFVESQQIDAISAADNTFLDAAYHPAHNGAGRTFELRNQSVDQKSNQTSGLSKFLDYAKNYQSNKMEAAVQNPGRYFLEEAAPYAAAAPILSMGGALLGASAIGSAPMAQQAGEKIQQAVQTYNASPTLAGYSAGHGTAPDPSSISQAVQAAADSIRSVNKINFDSFVADYNKVQTAARTAAKAADKSRQLLRVGY